MWIVDEGGELGGPVGNYIGGAWKQALVEGATEGGEEDGGEGGGVCGVCGEEFEGHFLFSFFFCCIFYLYIIIGLIRWKRGERDSR